MGFLICCDIWRLSQFFNEICYGTQYKYRSVYHKISGACNFFGIDMPCNIGILYYGLYIIYLHPFTNRKAFHKINFPLKIVTLCWWNCTSFQLQGFHHFIHKAIEFKAGIPHLYNLKRCHGKPKSEMCTMSRLKKQTSQLGKMSDEVKGKMFYELNGSRDREIELYVFRIQIKGPRWKMMNNFWQRQWWVLFNMELMKSPFSWSN